MSAAWTAFAATGRPATRGLPDWPAYDPVRREMLCFDVESRLEADAEADERRFFSGSPPRLPL